MAVCVMSLMGFMGVASAAAALPEFSTKDKEKVPLIGTPVHFESGELRWKVNGEEYSCEGGVAKSGTIIGAKEISATLRFTHCKNKAGETCSSPEKEKLGAGVTESATLDGTLFYLNKSKKEVGMYLQAASNKEGEHSAAFMTCEWGSGTTTFDGCVAFKVTPINTIVHANKEYFTVDAEPATEVESEGSKFECRVKVGGLNAEFATSTRLYPGIEKGYEEGNLEIQA